MNRLFRSILIFFALVLVTTPALAQLPPTSTYGLDFSANTQQNVSASGHLRLRYNPTTGQLEQSISNGAYFSLANPLNVTYVTAYGAKCDGATDDTSAIQTAVTAAPTGSAIVFPIGNCLITNTITFSKQYTHVVGQGVFATRITFNPAGTATAFKFSAGAAELGGSSLEGMTFYATVGNVQTKTAVEIIDTTRFVMHDVWTDPSEPTTWSGGGSIGVRIRGRELSYIYDLSIEADRPIVLSQDPNTSTIGNDHLHMANLFLRSTPGTSSKLIEVEDGTLMTNITFDGFESWIVDKYGFYMAETSSSTVSVNWNFSGVRCEQAVDPTGYCFYIDRTGTFLQDFDLHDSYMPTTENGVHLAGVINPTIKNVVFPSSTSARTHLDIGTNVFDLYLENNYVNANALVNFGALVLEWALPNRLTAANMPSTALYVDSTTASSRGVTLSPTAGILNSTATSTGAANANPWIFDTTNAFTGGSGLFEFKSGGTLKAYIDSGGSIYTSSGIIDRPSSAPGHLSLGPNFATGVDIGINGVGVTVKGLLQTALPEKVGSNIASASTIAPTAPTHHITGTTPINTITAPTPLAQTGGGGVVMLIFDGIAPWTAAGNIAVAGTPSVGQQVIFTYDNATSLWYPSQSNSVITYNIVNYGAVCDGSTDNTTAIQNAINAAKATHQTVSSNTSKGGVVYVPQGVCAFASPLDLSDAKSVSIVGATGYGPGFPQGSSVLLYTGTGAASAIKMQSAQGTLIENIAITYLSSSFTGYLLDYSHSVSNNDAAANVIDKTFLGSYNSSPWSAAALVYLNDAVSSKITNSFLAYAKIGILFRSTNLDYSNEIIVDNCIFHDFQTAATMNGGQGIIIQNSTFENNNVRLTPFMSPAYSDNTSGGGAGVNGLDFINNWVGDGDGSTNAFETATSTTGGTCGTGTASAIGLNFSGNFFAGAACLKNVYGAIVSGNSFDDSGGSFHPVITFAGVSSGIEVSNNGIVTSFSFNNLPATGVSTLNNTSPSTALTDQWSLNGQVTTPTGTGLDCNAAACSLALGKTNATTINGFVQALSTSGNNLTVFGNITSTGPLATSGATLGQSNKLTGGTSYWNGSTAVGYTGQLRVVMTSTVPQSEWAMSLGGTDLWAFNSGGTIKPFSFGVLQADHFVGNSTAPTTAAGTGAGTSPTIALTGNDADGQISVTTGTGTPAANAAIVTATFHTAYGSAPRCVISPANSATDVLGAGLQVYPTSSTTTVVLNSGTTGLAASTAYIWNYICMD